MAYHGLCVNQDGTLDPCCQYRRPGDSRPIGFLALEEFNQGMRAVMDRDFQQGKKHSGCHKCYQEEDLGWTTLRQHSRDWYGVPQALAKNPDILDLELRFGNVCNLKCMMCHPSASSAIAAERYQQRDRYRDIGLALDRLENHPAWWEEAGFDRWMDSVLAKVRRVNITGGEPFLIPQVLEVLAWLADRSPATTVSFNTNLTKIPPGLIRSLQILENVIVVVSLEGTGAMNDYVRYPSRWEEINANVFKLRRSVPHVKLGVNHTLQHASAYSLPDLLDYCDGQQLDLQMTMVQGMPWLGLSGVPPDDMVRFRASIELNPRITPERRGFLLNLIDSTQFDLRCHEAFRRYVETVDSIRGTNWDSVFGPARP